MAQSHGPLWGQTKAGPSGLGFFTSKGIGKNSERIEPLVLFPMGITDIGFMRQRGHHAIKLVGREYFDDPDIFDKNFEFFKIKF